jgi:hypothetical protein
MKTAVEWLVEEINKLTGFTIVMEQHKKQLKTKL